MWFDLAAVMDVERAVTWKDLATRFGLEMIMGESLTVPAALLIDHQPLWDLLGHSPEWQDCVFDYGLLKPACRDESWERFYRDVCGGTEDRPPLYMSSGSRKDNKIVFEAWEKAPRKYKADAGFEAFNKQFPWVKDRLEVLKKKAPIKRNSPQVIQDFQVLAYRSYLEKALESAERYAKRPSPYQLLRNKVDDISGRGAAFHAIDRLEKEGRINEQDAHVLTRLAISAKHNELFDSLKAKHFGQPKGVKPSPETRKEKRGILYEDEVPLLARVLDGLVGAEALKELAKDVEFIAMRNELVRLQNEPESEIRAGQQLERLCKRAAEGLGERRLGARITMLRGHGITTAMLGNWLSSHLPEKYQVVGYATFGAGLLLIHSSGRVARAMITWPLTRQLRHAGMDHLELP